MKIKLTKTEINKLNDLLYYRAKYLLEFKPESKEPTFLESISKKLNDYAEELWLEPVNPVNKKRI